jgi:hypothetical protein
MKPLRVLELVTAALCVVPWIVIAISGPDLQPSDDSWIVPLWVGGGVLVGFLSRRWWIALGFTVVIASSLLLDGALHPCVESPNSTVRCDEDGTLLVIFYFFPLTLVITSAGVLIRRVTEFVAARMWSSQG